MDRTLIAPVSEIEEILIPSPSSFQAKLMQLFAGGPSNLEIITDFDFTLSKYKVGSMRGPSTYQLLQFSVLSGRNLERVTELYNHYHPIEVDPTVPADLKQTLMHEWWDGCNSLILAQGFHKTDLKRFVKESGLHFRHGIEYFFEKCRNVGIPITILSGGIGNIIETSLQELIGEEAREEIKIFSNFIGFDSEGRSNGFRQPEVRADKSKVLEGASTRKNLLVIGDLPAVRSI